MGRRTLVVCRARPDTDAGYNLSVDKLDGLVARAEQAAAVQREAEVDLRTSTAQKQELRRAMLQGPIAHMAGVGRFAAKESGKLAEEFLAKPDVGSYARFLTVARAMYSAAKEQKDVLAKYGQSESVLEQFGTMLGQFEAAVQLGHNARAARKGATEELRRIATLIVQAVHVMDARNRQRFEDDPQALGEWLSARRVLGEPKAGGSAPVETGSPETPVTPPVSGSGTPAGGEVRPAA
jgi:hypothetical protein